MKRRLKNTRIHVPALASLDLTVRTRNALTALGVLTLPSLANMEGRALVNGHSVGEMVLRELLRTCTSQYLRPHWVQEVTIRLEPKSEAPPGYKQLTCPYARTERWMLELAIAQLGRIAWCVVDEGDGHLTLWRSETGYKDVGEEE